MGKKSVHADGLREPQQPLGASNQSQTTANIKRRSRALSISTAQTVDDTRAFRSIVRAGKGKTKQQKTDI
jgi:hypothetical protein